MSTVMVVSALQDRAMIVSMYQQINSANFDETFQKLSFGMMLYGIMIILDKLLPIHQNIMN
jgi:hypothetical protein